MRLDREMQERAGVSWVQCWVHATAREKERRVREHTDEHTEHTAPRMSRRSESDSITVPSCAR